MPRPHIPSVRPADPMSATPQLSFRRRPQGPTTPRAPKTVPVQTAPTRRRSKPQIVEIETVEADELEFDSVNVPEVSAKDQEIATLRHQAAVRKIHTRQPSVSIVPLVRPSSVPPTSKVRPVLSSSLGVTKTTGFFPVPVRRSSYGQPMFAMSSFQASPEKLSLGSPDALFA